MSKEKKTEEKKKEVEEEITEKEESVEKEEKEEKVSEEKILKDKVEELEKQNEELKDQMLRRQAELENYKKRLIREKEEAVAFSNSKLIEDLLVFLDNMERAISAAKNGGDIGALSDGVEMTRTQLLSVLDKNWGLKAIESVGKEFNPEEHEACMAVIDEKLEVETVLEEFQKGYKLHDRVIRPAKVKIGKPE